MQMLRRSAARPASAGAARCVFGPTRSPPAAPPTCPPLSNVSILHPLPLRSPASPRSCATAHNAQLAP
eukprot:365176-Chlamydomonas_euryale.AAC.9